MLRVAVHANTYQNALIGPHRMGEMAAFNGLKIWPAFSPGLQTGAGEVVSASLIVCTDDLGAGFLGRPRRPSRRRGRGEQLGGPQLPDPDREL